MAGRYTKPFIIKSIDFLLKKDVGEVEINNLISRVIIPEICRKYSKKYQREIKNVKDRLALLQKDYSLNFDSIDKCVSLASSISRLHKKFSFRQRKKLARAIFKRNMGLKTGRLRG